MHKVAATVLGCLLFVGCGGYAPAPAFPEGDGSFREPEAQQAQGVDPQPPPPMRLQPGDVVTVQVIATETTAYEGLRVDAQGMLHVPLAGDVEVGDLPLGEAEERVGEAVRRLQRVAQVAIKITEPAGHQATVVGAVAEPGPIQFTPGTRVAGLLAQAGGATKKLVNGEEVSMANLQAARLIRDDETVPVNVAKAVQGDPRHNVYVHPGDQLHVPPTMGQRISVLGDVDAPAVVPHRAGLRLTEALAMAGGISLDGDRSDVRVVRGLSQDPKIYLASVAEIVNGESHDPVLAPGDVVYVTEHWLASFGQVLDRIAPLLSTLTTVGLTATIIATD